MNIQPLYDVKERLEYAAVAGTGLLGEDFRLQRAAEGMKSLAAASPVFGKIDANLQTLLSAPAQERTGLLLDALALVDAVVYTQAKTGAEGELEPLPTGGGVYRQISCGQLQPLLTALTHTGGGRVEVVQSAWENHPEFFVDYRVLPVLIAGLGDSYGEMADLNEKILKQVGPAAPPLLKESFDPTGKREMVRRVKVISELEGADATPWLREILPRAKKDVRAAVIQALGADGENTTLLLDLSKTERGKNREAVLQALALQEGEAVRDFWVEELAKNSAAICHLDPASSVWASDLVAAGLRERLEQVLAGPERVPKETQEDLRLWLGAANHKSSPAMVECWRWVASRMESIDRLKNHISQPLHLGNQLTDWLLYCLCDTGAEPLCDLCRELWEQNKEISRWLSHAFMTAYLTRPAAEVYEEFSPYLLTEKPVRDNGIQRSRHMVMLKALFRLGKTPPGAGCLDRRWIFRLLDAVWKDVPGQQTWCSAIFNGRPATLFPFEGALLELADPDDPEQCRGVSAYFLSRMEKSTDWMAYGPLVLRFHGNPRGTLEKIAKKSFATDHLYYIWAFCSEAAKTLPSEEVAAILELFWTSKRVRKEDQALAEKAFPSTIAALRKGKPFPAWGDWWHIDD